MTWEVNLLNQVNQDTESANWMKNLSDSKSLAAVNMPGTHDIGAVKMFCEDGVSETWSVTECQQLYPDEQMNMGVRAFDIRCSTWRTETEEGVNDPIIVHGNYVTKCLNRDGSNMQLSDIMEAAKTFLKAHPSETIIMTIKADGDLGSHGNVAEAVAQYIQDKDYPLWRENKIPTVGEARGKVVLLRRYNFDNYSLPNGVAKWEFGFDLSSWDNYDYSKEAKAISIFSRDAYKYKKLIVRNKVYVQDYYKADSEYVKTDYFFGTIKKCNRK